MKSVSYSIIAVASVGILSNCKPKETSDKSGEGTSQGTAAATRETPAPRRDTSDREENHKDMRGFAMNRNDITRSLLTRDKPDWLSIGSPAFTESLADRRGGANWKNIGESKVTFSAGANLIKVGEMDLPASLATMKWSAGSFDSQHGRLLMVPLEMTEPAYLFKVENGKILEDSREEIPSINYDDKRRWFIQWETWISDSEIVGVINEEDLSGHTVTRSGLYLYNVDTRELTRVDLPYGFISGEDPSIEVVAVSPDGFVINTTDGEKVVSLKR